MSEMVDRVASAIAGPDFAWEEISRAHASSFNVRTVEHFRRLARAAISAMREPTDAMKRAGLSRNFPIAGSFENADGPWRRMIDEALK